MDIINQQEHHYDTNTKESLMRRLADASQYKIYPSIIPRNELPLRKILLTTRLWSHVRRQQAMLTIASDDWLFNQQQQQQPPVQQPVHQEQEQDVIFMFKQEQEAASNESAHSIPNNATAITNIKDDQWSWFDNNNNKEQEQVNSILLDSLSHEEQTNTQQLETAKKRTRNAEEQDHEVKKPKPSSTFNIHHFSTIDSPASPAGPASSSTTPSSPTNNSVVLLSA